METQTNGMLDALRGAARVAKSRAMGVASLLAKDGIVALRYEGELGGEGPAHRASLLYVGREAYAREFELYFRATADRGVAPPQVLFRGRLFEYAVHRARLEREAQNADIVVQEGFPGAPAHPDDVIHAPMLDGNLRVATSIEQQIRRMRSRGQRRLMRETRRKGEYVSRFDTSAAAFHTFRTTMYEPYVRARFGKWGYLDDPTQLGALYERSHGGVVFIAPRERPNEPVCGAILLDRGNGVLAYYRNGFVDALSWPADVMASRVAALEHAMLEHAIERRFTRVDFGYTRAFLNDGLLVHKRRLGCVFVPASYAPLFRLRVRPGVRAAIFARFPIVAGTAGDFSAILGYDDTAPRLRKRLWRAALKSYAIALWDGASPAPEGVLRAIVWTNAAAGRAPDPQGEASFREAMNEVLALPDGFEFRADRTEERGSNG